MEKIIALGVGVFGIGAISYLFRDKATTVSHFFGGLLSGGQGDDTLNGGMGNDSFFDFLGGTSVSKTSEENIIASAKTQLRKSLISKEGYKNTVYLDSLGKATVGIGHLVLPQDNLKLGDTISDARVEEFYKKDSEKAFNASVKQARELGKFTSDFIVALAHVNFQLGTGWPSVWKNTYRALKTDNYLLAINNIRNSVWAQQTPARTTEFIQAIKNAYT